MKVFIVEFDHKYGTSIWAAKSEDVAVEIVKTLKTKLYQESSDSPRWTLEMAMEDWGQFSGYTEFFRITEVSMVETMDQAKEVEA